MPWKECHVMDERLRFVARLLDGEKMAALCAEFGISRKTGYKIFDRYKDCGVEALTDRSRRPYRHANQLPPAVEAGHRAAEAGVSELGRAEDSRAAARPVSGPALPGDQHRARGARPPWPGAAPRRRRRIAPRARRCRSRRSPTRCGAPTTKASSCSANRRYCYPLTITDFASRYLLACEALSTTQEEFAFTVFERAFKEFGLPARDPHRQRRALRRPPTRSTASASWRCGGCASASRSSASSPAIPSRTAATSGCISR